jgi:hypothetical protein
MAVSPERKAEIEAMLDEFFGPVPLPKPKAVIVADKPVRDADVHVSRADINAKGVDELVEVRRPDYVTINLAAYERQVEDKREARRKRRELDPCRLGLYGPTDEEDD